MSRRVLVVLELVLVGLAGWQLFEVGSVVAARLFAPFDLEWMEGATLITGWRAAHGLPFYTVPDADYVPFLYPPLYAWTLGALSSVFPIDYPLGRGVSIVCTLIAASALYFGARQEGARPALAIGCVALFVSGYEEGGTFYDLVRIDMLALASCAWAIVLGRGDAAWRAVASGLLLAVSFATKHHVAVLGIPMVLALGHRHGWRRAALFAAASAGPALAFVAAMQWHTGGLFLTYLLGVPAAHPFQLQRALPTEGWNQEAQAEVWNALPLSTTVGLLLVAGWPRRAWWVAVAGTMLAVVSFMRGHHGGFINVLIPMIWLQALFPAFVGSALTGATTGWRVLGRRLGPHVAASVCAAQLWQADAPYARFAPAPADASTHAALVAELRAIEGEVLVPHAPWLPVQAGKMPSVALIALWDIDHKRSPFRRGVDRFEDALAAKRWSAVLSPRASIGHGLSNTYASARTVSAVPTRVGWPVRLRSVWLPK